jgi:CDP-diacylglycerol--glycerol-3-phosphate 3-phosphatidyltransferase
MPRPTGSLRIQWTLAAAGSAAALLSAAPLAAHWWGLPQYPARWISLTALSLGYFLLILWVNLPKNHRAGESAPLAGLGWGNALTILRAVLLSGVVGFLLSPRPQGVYAWLPGALYTLSSLPDYLDGYIARRTNHATRLGEILDMNVDSVGVFAAVFLAFQYGVMPWWYLPIGLARYWFVAGIWWRERRGKPVYEMPFSHRRRGFAALKMGFMFVMLLPLFEPPGTHWAAAAFGAPFAAAFLWDWGLVAGRVKPDTGARFASLKMFLLQWSPVVLRVSTLLGLPQITVHLASPDLRWLAYAEIAVTALLLLGVVPRVTAIAAIILLGINQSLAPLTVPQVVLVFAYIWQIFLGGGRLTLWTPEEWLVVNRMGDQGARSRNE